MPPPTWAEASKTPPTSRIKGRQSRRIGDGTWERLHEALRRRARVRLERDPQPSAGIVASQSVKTTGVGGEERGYDPAKKVKCRKRHLLVDTQALVMKAKVHAANVFDRDGIKSLMRFGVGGRFPRLSHLWLDAGYNGKGQGQRLGGESVGPERGGRAAPEAVGVGARGPTAVAANGFQDFIEEVGSGEDFLVAGPEQEDEHGL